MGMNLDFEILRVYMGHGCMLLFAIVSLCLKKMLGEYFEVNFYYFKCLLYLQRGQKKQRIHREMGLK
jgi:hypothetical protein